MASEAIIGKCLSMCPKKEIRLRENENLLHYLETINKDKSGKTKAKTNLNLAVKEYCRSAAGQQMQNPHLLRPPPVLLHTVIYLLHKVFNSTCLPWYDVYNFIADRLRAIRQDMIIQRSSQTYCIAILQPMVKFYAYAAYNLCEQEIAKFDPVLNQQHLNECLKMLLNFYDEFETSEEKIYPKSLKIEVKVENGFHKEDFGVDFKKNRCFMEALYIISNLGHDDPLLRSLLIQKQFKNNLVLNSFKISLFYRNGNWIRVCRLGKELPAILAGVFALHLPTIRKKALEVMSDAYSSKTLTFPCEKLKDLLLYNNLSNLMYDLRFYGITVLKNDNSVQFIKGQFKREQIVLPRKEEFVDEKVDKKLISTAIIFQ